MKRGVVLAGMLMGALVIPGLLTGCGAKKDVIALVGKQPISTQDFDQAVNNLPANYKILMETYNGKHRILDNLVKKALLVQEAERLGYQKQADVKEKLKSYTTKNLEKIDQQLAELKQKREQVKRQVYENVLLNEINQHLKKDGLKDAAVTPAEISQYYEDYVRKVKILNPAAEVPKLEQVQERIKAILIEEQLIKRLQKKGTVEIKESKFREIYGGKEDKDISIEDHGASQ